MQYLIVILDESATSFCYYPSPNRNAKLMKLEMLKDVIFFAQKEGWLLNFLVGDNTLPKEYMETIDVINHILLTPLSYPQDNVDNVMVLNDDQCRELDNIPDNTDKNVILRVRKENLSSLYTLVKSLNGKFRRLNITLENIDLFNEKDLNLYEQQLNHLSQLYINQSNKETPFEINIVSDRLFLHQMNNCDAGVKHITFAPNGNFYICPAFYYEDINNECGNLKTGINIKNSQLLRLDHAPICRVCDAYHCKRCVWLNKKTTFNVNTPSHEQCIVSHIERNMSRNVLERLHQNNIIPDIVIESIDYLDPFDNINKRKNI